MSFRPVLVLFLLAVAGAVVGGSAAVAEAGCGSVIRAAAQGPPGAGQAPLAIGDSTSIYATPILGRLGIEANAKGCRQFSQGVRLLRERRRRGTLPAVVVLALGANGPIPRQSMQQALTVLGPRRILLLVTARHSGPRNAVLRATVRRHRDRVVLVDWVAASSGHPGYFSGDGLHVGRAGAGAFARLIRRAVGRFAFPPVRRLRVPHRAAGAKQDCGVVHREGRPQRVWLIRGGATCLRARQLGRAAPAAGVRGWIGYDWRRTRSGPWSWVYARADSRVVVGVVGR